MVKIFLSHNQTMVIYTLDDFGVLSQRTAYTTVTFINLVDVRYNTI